MACRVVFQHSVKVNQRHKVPFFRSSRVLNQNGFFYSVVFLLFVSLVFCYFLLFVSFLFYVICFFCCLFLFLFFLLFFFFVGFFCCFSVLSFGCVRMHNMFAGRRRVILVAVVPTLSESHANITSMFRKLQFPWQQYPLLFCADFKLLNLSFGLSTNAATYPCVFCQRSLLPSVSSVAEQLTAAEPRTVASITKNFERRDRKGKIKKQWWLRTHPSPLPW